MRPTQPKQYFADAHRAVAYGGAIEWEELPSLAQQVAARRTTRSPAVAAAPTVPAWDDTLPSAFDAEESAPVPFREPIEGLATREVTTPEIFRHFFGKTHP
jgi:hypothetical protein